MIAKSPIQTVKAYIKTQTKNLQPVRITPHKCNSSLPIEFKPPLFWKELYSMDKRDIE